MATTTFVTWYADVLPYVPGCPLDLALQKIRQAAIDYCRMSRTWRYLGLDPIDLVAAQQTYVIGPTAPLGSLPAETVVVHVYEAIYAEVKLDVLTPGDFKAKSLTWYEDAGTPEALTLFNEGEVSLWRIPEASEADALTLPEIALAPTQAATGVDERVYQFGREAIAKGARGLLLQVPKKPYTDINLGLALWQQFEIEAGGADLRASSGRGHARIRTRTFN